MSVTLRYPIVWPAAQWHVQQHALDAHAGGAAAGMLFGRVHQRYWVRCGAHWQRAALLVLAARRTRGCEAGGRARQRLPGMWLQGGMPRWPRRAVRGMCCGLLRGRARLHYWNVGLNSTLSVRAASGLYRDYRDALA